MFSHEIEQDKGLPAPSDPIEHDHLIQGFWEENTFAAQDLLHLFENELFVGYNDFFKRLFADHDIHPYDKDKLGKLRPYVKDKYIESRHGARTAKSLEIESTWSIKSPLAPLYRRGVIPPFVKEPVLSLPKERSGGIYGECPAN